jgi:hypothetical protein
MFPHSAVGLIALPVLLAVSRPNRRPGDPLCEMISADSVHVPFCEIKVKARTCTCVTMDDAEGDDGKQIQVRGGGAMCMRRVHAPRGAARGAATGMGCRALANPAACSALSRPWGRSA